MVTLGIAFLKLFDFTNKAENQKKCGDALCWPVLEVQHNFMGSASDFLTPGCPGS